MNCVKQVRGMILTTSSASVQALLVPLLYVFALLLRVFSRAGRLDRRRTTFGGAGIINFARWSRALRAGGFSARTVVWSTPSIYADDTFDIDIKAKWGVFAGVMAPIHFAFELARTDTVVCGFDGFILGVTHIRRVETTLIKLAGRKVVVCPYGADAFVYRNVRSEPTMQALQISYPYAGRNQKKIYERVDRLVRKADFVFLGVMAFDGFGRWDALPFNSLVIDQEEWSPASRDWKSDELVVVHAPNHRGFKGTEFLVQAIQELQSAGESVRLQLLEGLDNTRVRDILCNEAHVLVEQLISTGYGMNGVEGLAAGVVVISNLEDERIMLPMKRWSFAKECPIISASPETIKEVLSGLISDRARCADLAEKSRAYAEKFHTYDAFCDFYAAIDRYLWANGESLVNYFHPILGSFRSNYGAVNQ